MKTLWTGALAMLLLAAAIPMLLALTIGSIDGSSLSANGGLGASACVPDPTDGRNLRVRLAHANLYTGMTHAQFNEDLTIVVAGGPDLVTLNEAHRRSPSQLTPPGYRVWRPAGSKEARDTAVLWRTDTWNVLDRGSRLMHHRPGVKWGTRYAAWATLRHTSGQVVSLIAGHASPRGKGRAGLIKEYVDELNSLIARLATRGLVLVGADLNIGYRASPQLASWLAESRTVSTFDALGEPPGGWGSGHSPDDPAIDYILLNRAAPLRHATRTLPHSDHRMLTADIDLAPMTCTTGPVGDCPPSGSSAEAGLAPNALQVLRCVNARFGPHAYGGVGERPSNPSSDHPHGDLDRLQS